MYDIFNPALEQTATEQGTKLVPAKTGTKAIQATDFVMAASTDRALFKSHVSMLYDLETLDKRKDHLHHRNSGLDTTLAKLCKEHDVLVGINLANLRTLDPVLIGRVMQNIELCRSHKVRMAVFSNAQTPDELMHETDVHSLLLTLGMSTAQAKETLTNLERKYKQLQVKKGPKI